VKQTQTDLLGTIITSIEDLERQRVLCLPVTLATTTKKNSLGPDPLGDQDSSSEDIHTSPSHAGPPKAKARPKPAGSQGPKEPAHPLPGWIPSLRAPDHVPAPKITTFVTSVPPPWTGG
jgi:hypothetical protein